MDPKVLSKTLGMKGSAESSSESRRQDRMDHASEPKLQGKADRFSAGSKSKSDTEKDKSALLCDSQITGERRFQSRQKPLKQWVPDVDNPKDALDICLDDVPKHNRKWDQFATNKLLFQITSDYHEDIYTTPIDRTAPGYKEREAAATKLAREIESSAAFNEYVAESRIQNQDSIEYDEEEMYSSVAREGQKKKNKMHAKRTELPKLVEETPATESKGQDNDSHRALSSDCKEESTAGRKKSRNYSDSKKSQQAKATSADLKGCSTLKNKNEPNGTVSERKGTVYNQKDNSKPKVSGLESENISIETQIEPNANKNNDSQLGLNVYAEEFKPLQPQESQIMNQGDYYPMHMNYGYQQDGMNMYQQMGFVQPMQNNMVNYDMTMQYNMYQPIYPYDGASGSQKILIQPAPHTNGRSEPQQEDGVYAQVIYPTSTYPGYQVKMDHN